MIFAGRTFTLTLTLTLYRSRTTANCYLSAGSLLARWKRAQLARARPQIVHLSNDKKNR